MSKRTNYDEVFCGKLPLHNINLIQPHGYLLIVEKASLKIVQVSENCGLLFNEDFEKIPGTLLQQWIETPVSSIFDKFGSGTENKLPFYIDLLSDSTTQTLLSLIHFKPDYVLIELFPTVPDRNSFVDVFQTLKHSIAEIELTRSATHLSEVIVQHLRKISGFDRVLMYRFDKSWNGKVIAESKAEDLNSYLGQQFPASDIPRQARAMYQKNAYRLIPDTHYKPVRLFPVINPLTHAFADLSDCSIRSVANVHLEYLENMGVSASMSFRILKDDQLWGLISLHHRTARFLDYETCSLFELLSSFISQHLGAIINRENFLFTSVLQEQKINMQKYLYQYGSMPKALFNQETTLLDMFRATGAAIMTDGVIVTKGQVPDHEFIENIGFWLQSKDFEHVFADSNFSSLFEEATDYAAIASGVMMITLDKEKGDFILLLRPEVEETIDWGGNPDEAVRFEVDKNKYHPRNSFENFREKIKFTSEEWHPEEIKVAGELRNFLFEHRVKH